MDFSGVFFPITTKSTRWVWPISRECLLLLHLLRGPFCSSFFIFLYLTHIYYFHKNFLDSMSVTFFFVRSKQLIWCLFSVSFYLIPISTFLLTASYPSLHVEAFVVIFLSELPILMIILCDMMLEILQFHSSLIFLETLNWFCFLCAISMIYFSYIL